MARSFRRRSRMIFGLFLVDQIFCVFDRACAGKPQNDRVALVNLGVPSEARRSEDRDHPSLIFSFPGDGTDFRLLLRNLLSACGAFDFRWSTHIFFSIPHNRPGTVAVHKTGISLSKSPRADRSIIGISNPTCGTLAFHFQLVERCTRGENSLRLCGTGIAKGP
jgi:hypothetical protein